MHTALKSGSEGEVRLPTCTLETLAWPSSPFVDHTDWNGQWTLRWPCVGHGWWLSEMEGATTHCRSSGSVSEWVTHMAPLSHCFLRHSVHSCVYTCHCWVSTVTISDEMNRSLIAQLGITMQDATELWVMRECMIDWDCFTVTQLSLSDCSSSENVTEPRSFFPATNINSSY